MASDLLEACPDCGHDLAADENGEELGCTNRLCGWAP